MSPGAEVLRDPLKATMGSQEALRNPGRIVRFRNESLNILTNPLGIYGLLRIVILTESLRIPPKILRMLGNP